jgi:hypothetical protein
MAKKLNSKNKKRWYGNIYLGTPEAMYREDGEPIIGHLKSDYRMQQNYLWSEEGIQINALMVTTAWNLKKMMETLKEEILHFIFRFFSPQNLVSCAG